MYASQSGRARKFSSKLSAMLSYKYNVRVTNIMDMDWRVMESGKERLEFEYKLKNG